MPNHIATRESEISSLSELRGDCARMAPHWVARRKPAPDRVPPERIHGVTVPAASARLVDGMSAYGD
ncbi:hypothetical protein AB0D98_01670 [Streptomyces sp. NPDC047987]|uniref:hypothetical protein n=1 Tax=unclassified Streptomyces TaxID=2593676 RepID=UPI003443FDDE